MARAQKFWTRPRESSEHLNTPAHFQRYTMAKKSKLLAALDAHKGRDYKLEKQKKLQRQAVKRKKARLQIQSAEAESEIEAETKTEIPINGRHELGEESEGWESDGGEDALPQTVG